MWLVNMGKAGSPPGRLYKGLTPHERRAQRRERLLEAGLDLLGTEGWQATTVTAVCKRARLTPRYFYESFRDRDELLLAIFDGIAEETTQEMLLAVTSASQDMRSIVRAMMAAFVKVVTDDPRKGRVTCVEALGSEALMRRRLERLRVYAELVSNQARVIYGVPAGEAGALDLASLFVAGGLIDIMMEWVDGRIEVSAEDLIESYANLSVASIEAAIPERRGPA